MTGVLWSTILDSAVTGWKVRNLIDGPSEKKLRTSKSKTLLFLILGLIPFLGKIIRRIWCRADWRRHYTADTYKWNYFWRALSGKIIEKTIGWYRAGRINDLAGDKNRPAAVAFLLSFAVFTSHIASLHRFLTDADFRKEKLVFIFVRPFKLYFSSAFREQWLRDMVVEGQKKHMLTDDDADTIISQIKEPYIQKYLVSLVVHLLMAPTTHIVASRMLRAYLLLKDRRRNLAPEA